MRKTKKQIKRDRIIVGIVLLVFVAWLVEVIWVNHYYKQNTVQSKTVFYEMGESVPFEDDMYTAKMYGEGYFLTINSAEVVDYQSYLTENGYTGKEYDGILEDRKILLVYATLSVTESDAEYIVLNEFTCRTKDMQFYQEWNLLKQINPILENEYVAIQLRDGTSCDLVFPFILYEWSLGSDFNHPERMPLYFNVTVNPTQKRVKLKVDVVE